MTSPYGYGYGYNPADAAGFWDRTIQGGNDRWQDQLSESRAERANRLQIANNQLKAQREQIAVNRGTAEADRWYKEQQVRLAESELGLDREKLALTGELGRGQLGLGLLELKSSLRGPADWAQYLDLGEGQSSLQPASGFLQAIAAGQKVPGTDMSFGGPATPMTIASLAGNTQPAQQARLQQDMQLAAQIAGNVGKVNPSTWASLSPDRLDYMKGLWEAGGHSARTVLSAADRAGIGQGSPFSY